MRMFALLIRSYKQKILFTITSLAENPVVEGAELIH